MPWPRIAAQRNEADHERAGHPPSMPWPRIAAQRNEADNPAIP
jgi:hypothetical protein